MKIVDDEGKELPWDGVSAGELKVRGPWVCSSYFRLDDSPSHSERGWFTTGDVAVIHPNGFLQITDRAKDVIKSGGEWISSITLENIAFGHPGVQEAAVIGLRHPKWGERPLLVVVRKPGADVSREALLDYFRDRTVRWWIPDDVVFVEELPHTATGKLSKRTLRERFRDHAWPADAANQRRDRSA